MHLHTGKVRDLYQNEAGDLVMVASDRMSAYDWVLPTEIPDKGRVLTQLSLWWFDQLADLVPNHVLAHRAARRRPRRLGGPHPGLQVAADGPGRVRGPRLPHRLGPRRVQASPVRSAASPCPRAWSTAPSCPPRSSPRPPRPPSASTTRTSRYEEVARQVGAETAAQLRQTTLAVYARARDIARERGIILADTKFEFGFDGRRRWSSPTRC